MSDRDFKLFIDNVKKATGVDLSLYKEAQMKRRLTSLREKRGFTSFSDYFQAIREDKGLYHEFLDRLTINVSEFFRNPGRWDVLSDKIIPDLLERKSTLRVWSAACSTGEEPYTLVMTLSKFMPLSKVNVLATDIDEGAIEKAKQGIYHERSLKDCPQTFIRRFFKEQAGLYRISDEIKSKVTFRKHNLLSDPFEKDFDLIVCRNVMIYFTEEAKDQLYAKFSRALAPGGVLFVGSTEQIFNTKLYDFETLDTFFYRKCM